MQFASQLIASRVLLAVALTALAPASALGQDVYEPFTIEEQEQMLDVEAEAEAVIDLVLREGLLRTAPETFHGPPGRLDRPLQQLVEDLLILDWTLRLIDTQGAESIDRVRRAAVASRTKVAPAIDRVREGLQEHLKPSRLETLHARLSGLTIQRWIERDPKIPPARIAAWEDRIRRGCLPRSASGTWEAELSRDEAPVSDQSRLSPDAGVPERPPTIADPPPIVSAAPIRPPADEVPMTQSNARGRGERILRWLARGFAEGDRIRLSAMAGLLLAWGAFGLAIRRLLRRSV